MTPDRNAGITDVISDVIGARIRELRERAGMTRDDLAAAAIEAGAPTGLSATVIRFLETGRPDRSGQRTRYFMLDELLGLAAGLEVSPMELLGDQAVLFVGDQTVVCGTCGDERGEPGVLERTVRADMRTLDELSDLEPSLAATAVRLAQAIDQATGDAARQLPALTRELRATLEQIAAGRRRSETPDDDDGDEFGDLDDPDLDDGLDGE